MGNLGAMALDARIVTQPSQLETLFYSIAANNVDWNAMTAVVPSNILDAEVLSALIESTGTATIHAGDYAVTGEVTIMEVRKAAQALPKCLVMSTPATGHNRDVATPAPTGWTAAFLPTYPFPVRGTDELFITAPPADDNGAPTGDYQLRVTLKVHDYSSF